MCLAVDVRTSGSATVWTMNSSVLESVKEAGICVGFSAFFTWTFYLNVNVIGVFGILVV